MKWDYRVTERTMLLMAAIGAVVGLVAGLALVAWLVWWW